MQPLRKRGPRRRVGRGRGVPDRGCRGRPPGPPRGAGSHPASAARRRAGRNRRRAAAGDRRVRPGGRAGPRRHGPGVPRGASHHEAAGRDQVPARRRVRTPGGGRRALPEGDRNPRQAAASPPGHGLRRRPHRHLAFPGHRVHRRHRPVPLGAEPRPDDRRAGDRRARPGLPRPGVPARPGDHPSRSEAGQPDDRHRRPRAHPRRRRGPGPCRRPHVAHAFGPDHRHRGLHGPGASRPRRRRRCPERPVQPRLHAVLPARGQAALSGAKADGSPRRPSPAADSRPRSAGAGRIARPVPAVARQGPAAAAGLDRGRACLAHGAAPIARRGGTHPGAEGVRDADRDAARGVPSRLRRRPRLGRHRGRGAGVLRALVVEQE